MEGVACVLKRDAQILWVGVVEKGYSIFWGKKCKTCGVSVPLFSLTVLLTYCTCLCLLPTYDYLSLESTEGNFDLSNRPRRESNPQPRKPD